MVCACNPTYSGAWGRRITSTQEVKVAVSRDHTAALQTEQQSWTLSQKKSWVFVICLKEKEKKKIDMNVFGAFFPEWKKKKNGANETKYLLKVILNVVQVCAYWEFSLRKIPSNVYILTVY